MVSPIWVTLCALRLLFCGEDGRCPVGFFTGRDCRAGDGKGAPNRSLSFLEMVVGWGCYY